MAPMRVRSLDVEALHEPLGGSLPNSASGEAEFGTSRFTVPMRVRSLEVEALHEPGSAGALAGALDGSKLAGKDAGAPRVHGPNVRPAIGSRAYP